MSSTHEPLDQPRRTLYIRREYPAQLRRSEALAWSLLFAVFLAGAAPTLIIFAKAMGY